MSMLNRTHYEYIVLGAGGLGSAAAYWLARRAGGATLALEQFALGHVHGGSQDHSRIIRLTYHHADYTRLTPHTYPAWAALEEESGVQVVHKTGGVEFARRDSPYLRDLEVYAGAMDAAGIPYERFDGVECMRRFPQFRLTEATEVLYQAETGLVDAAKGNAAHIATARLHGATVRDNCPVTGLRPFAGGVDVITEQGTFTARRLIITAGAWTDQVLAWVGRSLRITATQEQVTYYATPHLRQFALGRFPVFISHDANVVYGFPVYGEVATKAALDAAGPAVTPQTRTYQADPEREQRVEAWLREHLPDFLGPKLYTKTCLYDMPPDRNFVVDALPEHPQILVCSGAGHAYKFAGLLGQILSELALDGQTRYPIAPFTLNRPALTDPHFQPAFHI